MCFFHRWEKGEQFEVVIPKRRVTENFVLCVIKEYRQRRRCSKCGKVVEEVISNIEVNS